jgi:hypothetical protein
VSNDIHIQAILSSLEPLFQTAESGNLWFYQQDDTGEELWCSPEYLRDEQSNGRLIMSPEHWELRNPIGYLTKIIRDVSTMIEEYNALAKKLGYEETLALESHSTHPADEH